MVVPILKKSINISKKYDKFLYEYMFVKNQVELLDECYLTENLRNKITLLAQMNKREEIAKGWNIISKIVIDSDNYECCNFNNFPFAKKIKISRKILQKYHENLKELEKDYVQVKLEYTAVTQTFFISELEILKFEVKSTTEWKNYFCEKSTYEKINILLASLGLDARNLFFREKLFFLIRLVPLVIEKYFLLELSIKQIGKSTGYERLNKYVSIYNGEISVADIIYNMNNKKTGDIELYDLLVFDEIQKRDSQKQKEFFSNIQTYISSEAIKRGKQIKATASICFMGNTKNPNLDYDDLLLKKEEDIFQEINSDLKDTGLIDRINYIIPSWGMRKIGEQFRLNETNSLDIEIIPLGYLCEIFHLLREEEIETPEINFLDLNIRSKISIDNTAKGLIKLLQIDKKDFNKYYFLAMEGRFFLEKQLQILDGTEFSFPKLNLIIEDDKVSLTDQDLYEEILSDFLNISYKNIFIATPHHLIYKNNDKNYIVSPLDIIGIDEIKILSKYNEDNDSNTSEFIFENKEMLYRIYENLIDSFDNSNRYIEYQNPFKNYLYGYYFNKNTSSCEDYSLRQYRKIKNKSLICPECKSKLDKKQKYYEEFDCDDCEENEIIYVKSLKNQLKKLF